MSSSGRKRRERFFAAELIDESNSWCSTKRCQYPGCQSRLDGRPERNFCGQWHRDLHMSYLATIWNASSAPFQGKELLAISSLATGRQAEGFRQKCMLPECSNRASSHPNTGRLFDFCRKKHMLIMVERLTKVWSLQGRLCRLEDCYKHVHVDDDGECQQYCGRTHAKLAAARRGALVRPAAAADLEAIENMSFHDDRVDRNGDESEEQRSQISSPQGEYATTKSLLDGLGGYHQKISDLDLHRLLKREGNFDGVEDGPSIIHGIDIYEFHPWELVSQFDGMTPRYFLHEGHTPKKRITKDGFSWKQTGKKHQNSNQLIRTRYMSYKHGKTEEMDEEKCSWRLREITLPDSCHQFDANCGKVIWRIAKKLAVSSNSQLNSSKRIDNVLMEEEEELGFQKDPETYEKDTGAPTNTNTSIGTDDQIALELDGWNLTEDFDHPENQLSMRSTVLADDLFQDDTCLWTYDITGDTQTDAGMHFGGR